MPSRLKPVALEPSTGSAARLTDYASGYSALCMLRSIKGCRLHLSCSAPLPLRASVKIEHQNRLWTGDVWACEPDGDAFLVEVEASIVLDDLAALERLASRFMNQPDLNIEPLPTGPVSPAPQHESSKTE